MAAAVPVACYNFIPDGCLWGFIYESFLFILNLCKIMHISSIFFIFIDFFEYLCTITIQVA